MISFLALIGILQAEEDNADVFKKKAREDVGQLQKKADNNEIRDLEDSLNVESRLRGLSQPHYMDGGPSSSARLKEAEDKEKAEEEEKKRNWLLDSVRKLSGEQELTEEEKEKLENLSGDLNLVDRYVAEKLREQIEKEEGEARVKMAKQESLEEEEEVSLGTTATDYRPQIEGLAKPVSTDPLKALEEKFISEALRKNLPTQNKEKAASDSGNAPNNPYLEDINPSDFQFKEINIFASSIASAIPGHSSQSALSTGKTGTPSRIASGFPQGLSATLLNAGNNPFFASIMLPTPVSDQLSPLAGGLPLNLIDSQINILPTLDTPSAKGNAPQGLRQPTTDPKKPYRPLDDEKKYFPRLNKF